MSELIFGKYEVVRRLAIGGMGEVFLARQSGIPGFERLAILKNLLPELAEQEGFVEQFLDEARVAATLNHPNIVGVYEVGKHEGIYFLAMEYIGGENLGRLLKAATIAGVQLPLPVTARIIHDAALGLGHAHSAVDVRGVALGIVHRDVSPQNIMVRDDGVTKVVDFGIAKAANRMTRTATGALKGKLAYMSPEQAAGHELDARSDQFSLGVVFWELVTGGRLFRGNNELETLQKVLACEIPRAGTLREGVPPELDAVIAKMLAPDREARFATLELAATELGHYLDSVSRGGHTTSVAAIVKQFAGATIDEQRRSGSSSPGSFHVALRPPPAGGAGEPEIPIDVMTRSSPAAATPSPPPRRGLLLGGLAALVVTVGLLAFWATGRPGAPTNPPPEVVVAPPPPPPPPPAPAPPAPGRLALTTEPPGARVVLAGNTVATTPVTALELAPAVDHLLTLELAGFEPTTLTVRLAPGEARTLALPLAKLPAPPEPVAAVVRAPVGKPPRPTPSTATPATGLLTVDTTPWSRVTLDGEPLGSTPLFKRPTSVGRHTLRFQNESAGIDATREVEIKAGELTKLRLDLAAR